MDRVIVLISGRGSNLRSLITAAKNYKIVEVISNNTNAPGLQIADTAGIETTAFERNDAPSLIAHKKAIYQKVKEISPDLIVLAGFMQILEKDFVEQFVGKIVNIHPSLLPQFRGLDTHRRALDLYCQSNGTQSRHGCTVHYVHNEVDTGPIIAQSALKIQPGDTEVTLAQRVLSQEHQLFPWVVNEIADENICYTNAKVKIFDKTRRRGASQGFNVHG